ncbi:N-acetylneuraminate synthase family protein [Eggerthella guodeyinii]|uniref:N-acetylneuraminate synthase n=1 Tax=Eggerthella guodeyinii TaxID=2690837 RepID=A0A6N7RST0_9ACTN|nr:N-acetylneuraminate synthase family protein [Eggerthella guodeyinii]MRX84071.1 N-acetylneuraminate synthase [Eggerthella guodeyinii]
MTASFSIGSRIVGEGADPFVIAEAGINHNGDLDIAKKMIDVAVQAGVDAVKFQTFHAEDFISDRTVTYSYKSQGKDVVESMFDMFKKTEFSDEEWEELKRYCDSRNIIFLSTPVTVRDLKLLVRLGVTAVKVGSDDFTNIPLIKQYARYGLPLLLSCGMSDEGEICQTLAAVDSDGHDICLFLCTSQYPTPENDVNAKKLLRMRELFPNVALGFSDHTQGSTAAIVATAYGASVFEKHFTLDHGFPGPDHWFSSEPEELRDWAASIRSAYAMLGKADLQPTAREREMRTLARRSIVAVKDIAPGEVLTDENIGLRRPGTGIAPGQWDAIIGRTARESVSEGSQLTWEVVDL